jgi:hypothetical protein
MNNLPRPLIGICIGALIVRLALLWFLVGNFGTDTLFTSDSKTFYKTGANITAGHGFTHQTEPSFRPEAHFPPVYPYTKSRLHGGVFAYP